MGYAWWPLVAVILSVPLLITKTDPDLWFNTRFGLDLLSTHTFPTTDPYSFTHDRPWVNHEWLTGLIFGAAYQTAGTAGLILLKTAIVATAYALMAFALRRVNPLVSAGLLVLAIAASPSIIGTARAQVWTFLALVILVQLLEHARYWWLPLLFAVWVNLHGGWILGAGILGVWCTVTVAERWRRSHRIEWTLVALPLVSVFATIVNPYGWHMWHFLATTLEPNRDISEWRPLYTSAAAPWVAIGIVTAVTLACIARRDTRPRLAWLAVLLMLAVGAVRVTRIASLAAPLAMLIIGFRLDTVWPRSGFRWTAPSRAAAVLGAAPALAALYAVLTLVHPSLDCIPMDAYWTPDTGVAKVLRTRAVPGRLVTQFEWGDFAIWQFSDRLKVSWDGRRETVYSRNVERIHHAIYDGTADGSTWLQTTRPEYVWLRHEHLGRRAWLQENGYRVDVDGPVSYVAVRADLPVLATAALPPPARCFPGSTP